MYIGWDECIYLDPFFEFVVDVFLWDLFKGPFLVGLNSYVMKRFGGVFWLVVDMVRWLAECFDFYWDDGSWYFKDLSISDFMMMFEVRCELVGELFDCLVNVL